MPQTRNSVVYGAACQYAGVNRRRPGGAVRSGKGVNLTKARIVRSFLFFLIIFLMIVTPGWAQSMLYDNGPDGDIGYYHVNFGSAVSNSFVLSQAASIARVTLTLYDVDDRNQPQQLEWTISSAPLGGTILARGFAPLTSLHPPYLTQFLYFAWRVGFVIPSLDLPAGTYYLQIQDVITEWGTWAFWAESSAGTSQGYYETVGPTTNAVVSPVPSESFSVLGEER